MHQVVRPDGNDIQISIRSCDSFHMLIQQNLNLSASPSTICNSPLHEVLQRLKPRNIAIARRSFCDAVSHEANILRFLQRFIHHHIAHFFCNFNGQMLHSIKYMRRSAENSCLFAVSIVY